MNNKINIIDKHFNNCEIRSLIDEKKDIWFCGKDIATALGYKKPNDAISRHLKEKYKKKLTQFGIRVSWDPKLKTNNNFLQTIIINEPGVKCLLILESFLMLRYHKY